VIAIIVIFGSNFFVKEAMAKTAQLVQLSSQLAESKAALTARTSAAGLTPLSLLLYLDSFQF
jgi:hypothetical protein